MTTRIPHVEYTFDADGIFWHVRQVRMREALSTPFDDELHLVTRAEVSTAGVVGLPGVLTMLRGEQERIFRGVITAADVRAAGHWQNATSFAKSALEFRNSSRKQSALTREQKTEKAILDGMTMAVAVVGFALGAELALASFAIFVGQNILLNRDVWALVLPGVTRAPGPQQFLSQVLHTVDDDEFVKELREKAKSGPGATGTAGAVNAELAAFDRVLGELLADLDTPTGEVESLRRYWDVGGEPGASVLYVNFMATDILQQYYGFSEDAAKDIVRKSNEGDYE